MKKFLSLLLVVLMLAVPLASCSDPADDGEGTGDVADTGTGAETSGTGNVSDVLEIPAEDFDGYEFVVLTPTVVTYNYTATDFDEPSEDMYENALYLRNDAVENLLNITITEVSSGIGSDVYNLFKTAVEANTGDYGVTFNQMEYSCTATGAGLCYELDLFDYIDLDKSWWNSDCTEQLALGGMHYMLAGDIALSDKECIWAVYFIKELIEKYKGLEDPYQLVKNNEWTWDKMHEMAMIATSDENGSGALDSGDIYGFVTHSENFPASWESAGLTLASLDEAGTPKINWNSEQFVNVFEDIVELMGDTESVNWTTTSTVSDAVAHITTCLKEGKCLFGTEVIAFVRDYRENEYDFGILPYPKYSSDIDTYYSYIAVNSCVMTVGKDCATPYQTSIILEAMAAKGSEILMPAYYEGQLKSRYSRDEESGEMLDIIFANRCYDLGVFFNWGSAYSSLKSVDVNPASLYAKVEKQTNKQIEKAFEKLGL